MLKSEFHITKMDCPSEEQLIRMKLSEIETISKLEFDIPNRKLLVFHDAELNRIITALDDLNLNTKLISSNHNEGEINVNEKSDSKLLWSVLIINFLFFLIELSYGIISNSMGLVADSLDMLADAFVYALSLYAIGHTIARKKQIAKLSGYLQIALAVLGLVEVIKRFSGLEDVPVFQTMIVVSFLALLANATSLILLQKSKSKEAHIQASLIFTSNDVLINIGVIVAGTLVYLYESKWPDLIIGTIVFGFVINGAIRILKLSK